MCLHNANTQMYMHKPKLWEKEYIYNLVEKVSVKLKTRLFQRCLEEKSGWLRMDEKPKKNTTQRDVLCRKPQFSPLGPAAASAPKAQATNWAETDPDGHLKYVTI